MTRDDLVLEKIASVIAEASYMEEMEKVASLKDTINRVYMGAKNTGEKAVKRVRGVFSKTKPEPVIEPVIDPVIDPVHEKAINRILSRVKGLGTKAKGLGTKAEKYISRVPKKYRILAAAGLGAGGAGFGGYEVLKNRNNRNK